MDTILFWNETCRNLNLFWTCQSILQIFQLRCVQTNNSRHSRIHQSHLCMMHRTWPYICQDDRTPRLCCALFRTDRLFSTRGLSQRWSRSQTSKYLEVFFDPFSSRDKKHIFWGYVHLNLLCKGRPWTRLGQGNNKSPLFHHQLWH